MAVKKKFTALGRGLDDIGTGRGLDALIDTHGVSTAGSSNLGEINVNDIDPNPNQPRREFDEESLQELAQSIKEIGIVQPITLRRTEAGRYQIIAGERRWRAAILAELQTIPAYIRTAQDENVMEMALVENIQREDLNAIEIALAYEHLAQTTGMTQEKIASRVGKSRAAVANHIRLLKLPAQVQIALKNKEIDMGHARALLAIDSPTIQIRLFKEIVKNGYSVRKVEEMVNAIKNGEDTNEGKNAGRKSSRTNAPRLAEEYITLRDKLANFFGTKVQMTCSPKGKGKISIPFKNEEELEKIMQVLDSVNS